jgi:hypothetical protein
VLESHEANGSPYNNISGAPAQDQIALPGSAPAADRPHGISTWPVDQIPSGR